MANLKDFMMQIAESRMGQLLGPVVQPKEAEAFPIGRVIKEIGKRTLGALSGANKVLAGRILEGKVIKEIRKGKGDWRYIVFTDGTGRPVTKDFIHSLAQGKGTVSKMTEFGAKSPAAQLQQAEKSLQYHLDRAWIKSPKFFQQPRRQMHLDRLKELGDTEIPDLVGVWHRGTYLTMPKPYAELLEKAERVKIDKTKRGQFKR